MRTLTFPALVALLVLASGRPAPGQESNPVLAEILSHWEQASRKIQCLDITFTRYEYDLGEQTEQRRTGRVYWEAMHQGCDKIDGGERLNWDDRGTLWIQPETKSYERFPAWRTALVKRADQWRDDVPEQAGFWSPVRRAIRLNERAIEPPDEFLLATGFDAATFLERFDVSCEPKGDKILLTVLPRHERDAEWFRKVLVYVDADSFEPLGRCHISALGNNVFSHVFTKVTINETPSDRNELLWPDLQGLKDRSSD